MTQALSRAWATAGVLERVAEVLAAAAADIAGRKPVCLASGKCCQFEKYGHRLYVTTLELAWFLRVHGGQKTEAAKGAGLLKQFFAQEQSEGCPYQVGGLCTAREARPLGCRVYFCDANAQGWQNDVYELYHRQLVALHEEFGVEYFYVEWREGLGEACAGQSQE